ncbi:MAG: tetratricopeptide repeat protein [Methylococcales bacterium]|nr:tetratricopeptide repeat protein [Methylococcales bacterium]
MANGITPSSRQPESCYSYIWTGSKRIGPGIASISGVDKAIHQSTNVPQNAKIRWSKQLMVKVGKITAITCTLGILLWYLIPVGLLSPKKDTITGNGGNATYQQDKQKVNIPDHPQQSIELVDHVENDSKLVDQKRQSEKSIENIRPKPEIKPEYTFKQAIVFYGMKQFAEALPLFKQLAEDGNPEAQHKLGLMYENGKGTDRNLDKAISWYEKAAQQGMAKSQFNLGSLYLRELQDKNHALYWFKQAAEQQYPNAEFNLGVFYANGELGLEKDIPKAEKWLQLAEQHGYKNAGKYLSQLGK